MTNGQQQGELVARTENLQLSDLNYNDTYNADLRSATNPVNGKPLRFIRNNHGGVLIDASYTPPAALQTPGSGEQFAQSYYNNSVFTATSMEVLLAWLHSLPQHHLWMLREVHCDFNKPNEDEGKWCEFGCMFNKDAWELVDVLEEQLEDSGPGRMRLADRFYVRVWDGEDWGWWNGKPDPDDLLNTEDPDNPWNGDWGEDGDWLNSIREATFTADKRSINNDMLPINWLPDKSAGVVLDASYRPPAALQVSRASRRRFATSYYRNTLLTATSADVLLNWLSSLSGRDLGLLREVRCEIQQRRKGQEHESGFGPEWNTKAYLFTGGIGPPWDANTHLFDVEPGMGPWTRPLTLSLHRVYALVWDGNDWGWWNGKWWEDEDGNENNSKAEVADRVKRLRASLDISSYRSMSRRR